MITIVDIQINKNGTADLKYKVDSVFKESSVKTSEIHDFLCKKYYADGIRQGEVERFLIEKVTKKEFFYVIQFIKGCLLVL